MARKSRFERELGRAVWPRTSVDLRAVGVTAYQLRGPGWRQCSRGWYVPADAKSTSAQRIAEATPLIPAGGALGGWAAAYVGGVDYLDGVDPYTMRPLPIPMIRGSRAGHIPRDWIACSYDRLGPDEVIVRHGIPITIGIRTCFDGMRNASSLDEAVSFADACLHHGVTNLPLLGDYCATRGRWRGIKLARLACCHADPAARNPWESRLRLLYVLEAGLPRPLANVAVFTMDGELIAIVDLLDPEAGLVVEFDGRDHRERHQHRADNVREEAVESLGLTVVRADSLDLVGHRRQLCQRLRAGHERGMARDRTRDRWTTQEPGWWLAQYEPVPYELSDAEKDELFG